MFVKGKWGFGRSRGNALLNPPDFEERSERLDMVFADYLKGRSVAIVGRGEMPEQGGYIDSHDVVVRIHDHRPYYAPIEDRYAQEHDLGDDFPYDPSGEAPPQGMSIVGAPDWYSRLGRRCDVMYYHRVEVNESPEQFERNAKQEAAAFRERGGKFLCAESWFNHQMDTELLWQDIGVRFLTMDHWLNTMRALKGSRPFAGALVVTDILRHDVERVYITGMSRQWIEDDYKKSVFISRAPGPPEWFSADNNLRFLVNLETECPGRVTIDENMKKSV